MVNPAKLFKPSANRAAVDGAWHGQSHMSGDLPPRLAWHNDL
jgi:hypothetical protein